jgi:hypothetical protein
MKKYFALICLFLFSIPEGRASVNEKLDIKNDVYQYYDYFNKNNQLFQMTEKKLDLYMKLAEQKALPEKTQEYFGTSSLTDDYLKKLKNIRLCVSSLTDMSKFYLGEMSKMTVFMNPEHVGSNAFLIYCHYINGIKNLEDKRKLLPVDAIGLIKDIDNLQTSLESVKCFFSSRELYLFNFLSISQIDNKNTMNQYDVKLSISRILASQINHSRNILELSNKINPDKFLINGRYKNILKEELSKIKFNITKAFSQKIQIGSDMHRLSRTNLAKNEKNFQIPWALFNNWEIIQRQYTLIFNTLNLEFSDKNGQIIILTPEERKKNYQIYLNMIAPNSEGQVLQKKKKNKNKQQNLSVQHEQSSEIEKESVTTITSSGPLEDYTKEDLFNPLDQSLILEENNAKEANLPELPQETEINECKKVLQGIMKSTENQEGDNYSIFQKALSLFKHLATHEYLLPDIQEATSQLLMELAECKIGSSRHKQLTTSQIFITEKNKKDYLFIMSTPVRYLKNALRFGVVRRFIEAIGGSIDVGRAGSRIGIKLNGKTTTLHLHDSKDGILDGGRIMSLRHFITNAGVVLESEK